LERGLSCQCRFYLDSYAHAASFHAFPPDSSEYLSFTGYLENIPSFFSIYEDTEKQWMVEVLGNPAELPHGI
jgi:hypothetical protein